MNGLFYLDEIFYSENSPYLYGIDTFSSINQSKPIQTMEHYVNIMLDSGFKAVFGDKQVMMDFINAALYDEREVADLNYMDKEISPELSDGRTVIFDLLCEDTDGAKFIVEMQNCPQNYFFNRGFYYICRMISRQGEKGPGVEIRPAPGIWNLPVELQPSRVPFMANGRGSGKRANR